MSEDIITITNPVDFMDKSFEWIKSNETELRAKIEKAEAK